MHSLHLLATPRNQVHVAGQSLSLFREFGSEGFDSDYEPIAGDVGHGGLERQPAAHIYWLLEVDVGEVLHNDEVLGILAACYPGKFDHIPDQEPSEGLAVDVPRLRVHDLAGLNEGLADGVGTLTECGCLYLPLEEQLVDRLDVLRRRGSLVV